MTTVQLLHTVAESGFDVMRDYWKNMPEDKRRALVSATMSAMLPAVVELERRLKEACASEQDLDLTFVYATFLIGLSCVEHGVRPSSIGETNGHAQ